MSERAIQRLEDLARSDRSVAPLARLHAEALRASADAGWAEGLPPFEATPHPEGIPRLHGAAVGVDARRARDLLARLADLAAGEGAPTAAVGDAVRGGRLDALDVLQAALGYDEARTAALAQEVDAPAEGLLALGQVALAPLLRAAGQRLAPVAADAGWGRGYCPLCGAWPTLCEMRGLERRRWLRCGRCASGWGLVQQQCPYCGSTDFRDQGYLAAEAEREARRAETCGACRGYLKVQATFGPLDAGDLVVHDLSTLELDVACLEQEFGRPTVAGYRVEARLEPLRQRSGLWQGWRR